MLRIKNLTATTGDKKILDGVNLKVGKGELHIILGPNGSGKSTLGKVMLSNPKFNTTGEISFEGENIFGLSTHEIAKKGILLSHQHPIIIDGVSTFEVFRAAQKQSGEHISLFKFKKQLKEIFEFCHIKEEFLDRDFNKGSSGGEMKKIEIAFLLALNSKLAFLDEIDSGLDFDALKVVIAGMNKFLEGKKKSIILVTHSKQILDYLNPDFVHIFCDGQIIKTGKNELMKEVHDKGYNKIISDIKCENCGISDQCSILD